MTDVFQMERVTGFTMNQMVEQEFFANLLRTTQLVQGRQTLKGIHIEVDGSTTCRHCCLGVYTENKGKFEPEPDEIGNYYVIYREDGGADHFETSYLVPELESLLGFDKVPRGAKFRLTHHIGSMNDNFEYNFDQVATEIDHMRQHGTWTQLTAQKLKDAHSF